MRIFLTGAGGFVGRHLVKRLQGHDVTCFVRKDSEHLQGFKTVKGDLKYIADVVNSLKDVDVVIHLAANLWVSDNYTMYLDNVVATNCIVVVYIKLIFVFYLIASRNFSAAAISGTITCFAPAFFNLLTNAGLSARA
mgnify:CR=1 FL=1